MAASTRANRRTLPRAWILTGAYVLALAGCGGSDSPSTYIVSGSITGLAATGLVLRDNGGDDVTPAVHATYFQFPSALQAGTDYQVTVATQPTGLTCSVAKASGDNIRADVRNVAVTCVVAYPIAGKINGLNSAGLILRNNGGDDLAVAANATSFQFATQAAYGSGYSVSILAQPKDLTCSVNGGTGTDVTAAVSGIDITCSATPRSIGGSIIGLSAAGLVLQNNGADNLRLAANATTFQFGLPVADGGGYAVTVLTQPAGLTCSVSNGVGTHVHADIGSIQVICSQSAFSIGGTISGLTAAGLVLRNNGGDDLSVAAHSTTFEFAAAIAEGGSYAVTVAAQPTGQTCSVGQGTGVATAQVTGVTLTCANIVTFSVAASSGANGSISPSGAVTVNQSGNQGFVATPAAGYVVDQWLLDGSPVQSGGSVYTLSNVTANHTIAVTFGQAALSSSVATMALSTSGNAREITITSTGSLAAVNVHYSPSPALPSGTVITPATCGTIAPSGTCVLTITPGATPSATPGDTAPTPIMLSIAGDNVSTSSLTLNIVTYASVYQAGFIYSIDDTTAITGSIGGKVAALNDQAEPFIRTGAQATSILWSTNGSGGVSYDIIPLIAEISTPNDSYSSALAGFNSTYVNTVAYPFPASASFSACAGGTDGACNSANILAVYNDYITNYTAACDPNSGGSGGCTLSAGPTAPTDDAAGLCSVSNSGGYTDWYLPAICEMGPASNGTSCPVGGQDMMDNLPSLIGDWAAATPSTSCPAGGSCLAGYYWSSTQVSGNPRYAAWG